LGGPSTLPNPEAATYPVHLETKRVEQKSATSLPLVLVVDDEPTVLKLFSVFLENLGCEADLVSTGPEALESFMRRSYNLVFMDCNLPGMNGYQAVMEIRRLEASNPSKGRALIITMTGGNLEDWASRYPEADVDGHLPKPFEFNRLKEIVVTSQKLWAGARKFETKSHQRAIHRLDEADNRHTEDS
jgi:CheY-like chemotaxis protein